MDMQGVSWSTTYNEVNDILCITINVGLGEENSWETRYLSSPKHCPELARDRISRWSRKRKLTETCGVWGGKKPVFICLLLNLNSTNFNLLLHAFWFSSLSTLWILQYYIFTARRCLLILLCLSQCPLFLLLFSLILCFLACWFTLWRPSLHSPQNKYHCTSYNFLFVFLCAYQLVKSVCLRML